MGMSTRPLGELRANDTGRVAGVIIEAFSHALPANQGKTKYYERRDNPPRLFLAIHGRFDLERPEKSLPERNDIMFISALSQSAKK
jgi:hypothetical protein